MERTANEGKQYKTKLYNLDAIIVLGSFMFIWFLQRNKHHLKSNGEAKINDNALVAIALLVAQSDPTQKDIMIQLIINLIRDTN